MQHAFHDLRGSDGPPEIEEFLDMSNLDIWGTERIRTPSSLCLPIPRYVPRGSETITQPLYVDYGFASLEHCSKLFTDRADTQRIVFTMIEAGRTGGRSEQLSVTSGVNAFSMDLGLSMYDTAQGLMDQFQRELENKPVPGPDITTLKSIIASRKAAGDEHRTT